MNFWRTLFDRQLKPYKPTYPVTGIDQPTATTTTVSQTITYSTLALSATTFFTGLPSSGTIDNALATSTIVAVGLPSGLTINAAARTWAWDGTGIVSSGNFQLYENLPGGTSNPHISTISYTISAGALGSSLDFTNLNNSALLALIGG